MLTADELKRVEALLLREREAALEALGHFEEGTQDLRERAGELSLYRSHPADIGTESMEKEKEFLLASNEGRRLYQIDEALRRLYKDPEGFGTCARCGQPITFERLEVVPETRYCARCQRELEGAAAPA